MTTYTRTVYGPGGFDPSKPNNNVVSQEEFEAESVPDETLTVEERLAELEREIRGIKERAAAAQVAGDARKVRDAVVGD